MEIETLAELDEELNQLWRLGRSAIIGWCCAENGIEVLAVPQFLLSNLLNNREDFLADIAEVPQDDLHAIAELCEIQPYRIYCPKILMDKDDIDRIIHRYRVSFKKNKGVILLDTVGFSRYAPLDQVTLLSSLSYSINIASKRARANGLQVDLEHSTTGDGFYVWNRMDGFTANVDLFCVMMLILADNAIAQEKSMPGKVPNLRSCFHIGNCYEYFLARTERPSESSYIVGDVTIDAARMVGRTLPGQILIGNFVCPLAGENSTHGVGVVNTPEFIEVVRERLKNFEGVILSRDTINTLVCHLTGEPTGTGGYNLLRYIVSDKHGYKHEVFNSKINIHRSRSRSVFLGLRSQDLDEFSIVAKTTTHFSPYADAVNCAIDSVEDGPQIEQIPPKILIVDDEPLVRDLLAEWLHEAGFATLEAGNAATARDLLEDHQDVVMTIIDVMLPGDMSGIDFALYTMALGRGIKTVFVSGYSSSVMLDQEDPLIRKAPFLSKPFELSSFTTVIESELDGTNKYIGR